MSGCPVTIFNQILKKNIFPRLKTPQAYSLLRLMVLLVWSIAVLGIIAWVSMSWFKSLTNSKENTSNVVLNQPALVMIDDVIVAEGINHIALDVRVRNKGYTVANITRLNIHVLRRVPFLGAYSPSASYDLLLSGADNEISVSHALKPEEVDSFIVKIGFTKYNTSCGFNTRLELFYNANQKAVFENVSFSSVFKMHKFRNDGHLGSM